MQDLNPHFTLLPEFEASFLAQEFLAKKDIDAKNSRLESEVNTFVDTSDTNSCHHADEICIILPYLSRKKNSGNDISDDITREFISLSRKVYPDGKDIFDVLSRIYTRENGRPNLPEKIVCDDYRYGPVDFNNIGERYRNFLGSEVSKIAGYIVSVVIEHLLDKNSQRKVDPFEKLRTAKKYQRISQKIKDSLEENFLYAFPLSHLLIANPFRSEDAPVMFSRFMDTQIKRHVQDLLNYLNARAIKETNPHGKTYIKDKEYMPFMQRPSLVNHSQYHISDDSRFDAFDEINEKYLRKDILRYKGRKQFKDKPLAETE